MKDKHKDEEFVKTTAVDHQEFADKVCKKTRKATQVGSGAGSKGKKMESHSRGKPSDYGY